MTDSQLPLGMKRSKSLSRPERQRRRTTMIQSQEIPHHLQFQLDEKKHQKEQEETDKTLTSAWAWIAYLATCCIPSYFLRTCFGKSNKNMQQAWREKVTLCYLIALLCGLLAYVIYGLHLNICPQKAEGYPYSTLINGTRQRVQRSEVSVFGKLYSFGVMQSFMQTQGMNLTTEFQGMELGALFDGDTHGACAPYRHGSADPTLSPCTVTSSQGQTLTTKNKTCIPLRKLQSYRPSARYISFEWQDIHDNQLVLVGGSILNLTQYNNSFGPTVDQAIQSSKGNDMTYALLYTNQGKQARSCLVARHSIGIATRELSGCIADKIIMNIMFAVVLAIIIIRYSMALLFQWVIARRLTKPGGRSNWLAWRSVQGGNDDPANHAALLQSGTSESSLESTDRGRLNGTRSDIVNTELYTVMLVTCYSEGEEGLRTTMDSLSNTTYSDQRKIFFVIADGLITGAGESRSTPDIVIDMMDLDPLMANPKPCSYLAVANGEKQLNMAKVYAGHYNGTPCITIVKCGTKEEQRGPKAGNRGKRDSQVILMTFFQRVLLNDRLTELDYDIFWKMTWLMKGVTPDRFETVLMVDADTEVLPDALTYMVAAMANDITIMGLCGETRIANKRASWVTAIQVFEYYISHHYAKAFESLFGMVTCLPGCFSMYRIKAPKCGAWVPILANPDIVLEYNQNTVTTLHEKNLLLLGEDRFLSTLMLRTFPKRQMMFVPQARCRTVVPDTLSVLLSQRRRWINSTIHNLMELVLVSDLCGIACLSMQFSVFVDLIGTLVLPAAIVMSIYLIVQTALSTDPQWQSLGLLVAILFLPAILISITTFKWIYICWLVIYICALPVWNMLLPLYSFWHFDDFSWGATRVVVGEKKQEGHGDGEGIFDSKRLIMKTWRDWENERRGLKPEPVKIRLKTPKDIF
ncbi:hypothetical protein G6F23_009070 [Rhizopus arrhizus]|nr:hypothetical protein G6F23_009070 [Rhizopus arrhizus]